MSDLSIQDIENLMEMVTELRSSGIGAACLSGPLFLVLTKKWAEQEATLLKILKANGIEMSRQEDQEEPVHQEMSLEPYFGVEKEMYEDWEEAR